MMTETLGTETKVGWRVQYVPSDADEARANWGANKSPVGLLDPESVYEVTKVEVHSWHTKLWVNSIGPFNSTHFVAADGR
jgi:hypothetical protein